MQTLVTALEDVGVDDKLVFDDQDFFGDQGLDIDPDFVKDGEDSDQTQWNIPDFLTKPPQDPPADEPFGRLVMDEHTLENRQRRFRYLATLFVSMLKATVIFYMRTGNCWDDCPVTRFMAFFILRVDQSQLIEFLCDVFSAEAQYILASKDWKPVDLRSLPRVSTSMTGWGVYVDVMWHRLSQEIGIYIGSATGIVGFIGRLCTYGRFGRAEKNTHHHRLLWECDWQPSFHQLADVSTKHKDKHRVWTILAESFGVCLTSAYDTESRPNRWNITKITEKFVRQFQRLGGIPDHRANPRFQSVNRALPFAQGVKSDKRFKETVVCFDCRRVAHPSLPIKGFLMDLARRLCSACYTYKIRHENKRPSYLTDRYQFWKATTSEKNCQICTEPFSRFSTKNTKGANLLLPDLALKVCKGCDRNWKKCGFMFPINGLHIPYDHRWCCDLCQTTSSQCFEFRFNTHSQDVYACFDCISDNRNSFFKSSCGIDAYAKRNRANPVVSAGYPSIKELHSWLGNYGTPKRDAFLRWTQRNFGVDLTTREACIEQRKSDIAASTGEELSRASAVVPGEALRVRKDDGNARHWVPGQWKRGPWRWGDANEGKGSDDNGKENMGQIVRDDSINAMEG